MKNIGTPKMSAYGDRTVEIHVSGVCRQDVKRMSDYTVKVSHSRMNQAMQEIHRLGGQITGVSVSP